jgi:uncharacterized membrane protein YsdA (DUF1294 family)
LGVQFWPFILAWYVLLSTGAFAIYAHDKRRARRGGWRVPEARLHLVELLGGWPGAALARRILRHKTRRVRFLLVSWSIALAHLVAWSLWLWWI